MSWSAIDRGATKQDSDIAITGVFCWPNALTRCLRSDASVRLGLAGILDACKPL